MQLGVVDRCDLGERTLGEIFEACADDDDGLTLLFPKDLLDEEVEVDFFSNNGLMTQSVSSSLSSSPLFPSSSTTITSSS